MVKIFLIAQNTLKMSNFKKQTVKLVKALKEIFYKGSKLGKLKKFHKKGRNKRYFIWYFQVLNMSKSENQKNILCGSLS